MEERPLQKNYYLDDLAQSVAVTAEPESEEERDHESEEELDGGLYDDEMGEEEDAEAGQGKGRGLKRKRRKVD